MNFQTSRVDFVLVFGFSKIFWMAWSWRVHDEIPKRLKNITFLVDCGFNWQSGSYCRQVYTDFGSLFSISIERLKTIFADDKSVLWSMTWIFVDYALQEIILKRFF